MVVRLRAKLPDRDALADLRSLPLRTSALASPAPRDCDRGWSNHRQVPAVNWRMVPPVYSPSRPLAITRALAAAMSVYHVDRASVESTLRARYRASDVVLTDSGTSALILALTAFAGPGATVAMPGYACIDLTTAALGARVSVRLYDLDPHTLSPDLGSIEKAFRRGVDAIVVSHLFGYPADVAAVQSLAESYGVEVIEDAAQGSGGSLAGKPLGSLGAASIISFGRGKGITAGAGGALLLRTRRGSDWAIKTGRLKHPASGVDSVIKLAAQWLFARSHLYRVPASVPGLRLGEMVYHEPREPRAMSRAAVSLVRSALALDASEVQTRRRNASQLLSACARSKTVSTVRAVSAGESGYLRLPLIDADGNLETRPALGVMRGYPLALDQHQQLQSQLRSGESAGTGATYLRDRLFTLPTHSRVSDGDLARLTDWLAAPYGRLSLRLPETAPRGAFL